MEYCTKLKQTLHRDKKFYRSNKMWWTKWTRVVNFNVILRDSMTSTSLRGLANISKGFGIQDGGRECYKYFWSLPQPMHNYLVVQDNCPYQPKSKFGIAIHNVFASNVHKFNLKKNTSSDLEFWVRTTKVNGKLTCKIYTGSKVRRPLHCFPLSNWSS